MTDINDKWADQQRRRWMQPNAHLYIRPDAYRFMAPDAPRLLGKDAVGYFWPSAEAERLAQSYERKFDPDQPRVPAGNSDGGQWTNGSDSSGEPEAAPTDISAARRQSAAYCWNQMQIDILYCQSLLPSWRVAACISQANERFSACLVGKPMPPLPF
jgi:hypothetical protein